MNPIIKLVLLLIPTLLPALGAAQNPTKSVEECIAIAIENNLTLKSGKIALQKAKDLQGTAFNIGRTSLSVSQDPSSGGSPDNSISISQSFDLPNIYLTRSSLMKAQTRIENSRLEMTKNELIKAVSSAYFSLLYAKERITILKVQDSIYTKFLFLATAKFNSGETNRLEKINAERLHNENRIELVKAERYYDNQLLLLQKWMNSDEAFAPKEFSLPILELQSPLTAFNADETPTLRLYENQTKASEKSLSLTKQAFLPDFNFSLRNQLVIDGFNPYQIPRNRFDKGNFMGFEVGLSIPLFFGEQRAKTKAARRDVEIAKAEQKAMQVSIQKEYQSYINDYYKAKTGLDYYKNTGSQQGKEIAKISQIAYEKGEIAYVEYIQNLKTAVEIHLQYANAIQEYNQTVLQLNYLQGNK